MARNKKRWKNVSAEMHSPVIRAKMRMKSIDLDALRLKQSWNPDRVKEVFSYMDDYRKIRSEITADVYEEIAQNAWVLLLKFANPNEWTNPRQFVYACLAQQVNRYNGIERSRKVRLGKLLMYTLGEVSNYG